MGVRGHRSNSWLLPCEHKGLGRLPLHCLPPALLARAKIPSAALNHRPVSSKHFPPRWWQGCARGTGQCGSCFVLSGFG